MVSSEPRIGIREEAEGEGQAGTEKPAERPTTKFDSLVLMHNRRKMQLRTIGVSEAEWVCAEAQEGCLFLGTAR